MTTPVKLPSGRPMSYGFGLTIDTIGGRQRISHGGGINGFISALTHVPQDSLIVAVLSNTSPAPSDAVAAEIVRAVLGISPSTFAIQKEIGLSAEDRARYVGTYALTRPDGTKNIIRIIDEGGQLKYQPDGQRALLMNNQGPNVFIAVGAGRVAFDLVNGKAVGFQFGGGARTLEAVRQP
jgi:CubicO group peptidase (beta-lactamase class C family)